MTDEPAWYRQPMLACEFCGKPGHFIPIPERPVLAVAELVEIPDRPSMMETAITCPEHRFLVRTRHVRVKDEEWLARQHGRPVLGDEPDQERLRRAFREVFRRLGYELDTP